MEAVKKKFKTEICKHTYFTTIPIGDFCKENLFYQCGECRKTVRAQDNDQAVAACMKQIRGY